MTDREDPRYSYAADACVRTRAPSARHPLAHHCHAVPTRGYQSGRTPLPPVRPAVQSRPPATGPPCPTLDQTSPYQLRTETAPAAGCSTDCHRARTVERSPPTRTRAEDQDPLGRPSSASRPAVATAWIRPTTITTSVATESRRSAAAPAVPGTGPRSRVIARIVGGEARPAKAGSSVPAVREPRPISPCRRLRSIPTAIAGGHQPRRPAWPSLRRRGSCTKAGRRRPTPKARISRFWTSEQGDDPPRPRPHARAGTACSCSPMSLSPGVTQAPMSARRGAGCQPPGLPAQRGLVLSTSRSPSRGARGTAARLPPSAVGPLPRVRLARRRSRQRGRPRVR